MRGRGAAMGKRALERALALSRQGNVAGALEAMAPKGSRAPGNGAKRSTGRAAQAVGASFQTEIRESLRLEADAGRCVWAEGNPRVRGYPGAMFPVEKATVDFQMLAASIGIAFDCKTFTARETWTLETVGDPDEVERHRRQVDWLMQFRKQGGISFLLLYETKRDRAWLCFQLKTLLDGGTVQIRTLEREKGGIPARIVDHLPALERSPRLVGPAWRILDAALAHGRKTLPLDSPFRTEIPNDAT